MQERDPEDDIEHLLPTESNHINSPVIQFYFWVFGLSSYLPLMSIFASIAIFDSFVVSLIPVYMIQYWNLPILKSYFLFPCFYILLLYFSPNQIMLIKHQCLTALVNFSLIQLLCSFQIFIHQVQCLLHISHFPSYQSVLFLSQLWDIVLLLESISLFYSYSFNTGFSYRQSLRLLPSLQ